MPIQSTSEGKISLAKGISFTKIGLANGYILKLWAAPPTRNLTENPPVIHPPRGLSINDFISDEETSVTCNNFDSAVNIVAKIRRGALMAKLGVKSAFRICPINKSDWHLPGFTFMDMFLCLPLLSIWALLYCKSIFAGIGFNSLDYVQLHLSHF